MKNRLEDLNNYLFEQIERLSDESLKGDELKEEINRSKALSMTSREIVSNARLALDAQIAVGNSISRTQLPGMIESKSNA